jgi:YjbE family integral membrane protein
LAAAEFAAPLQPWLEEPMDFLSGPFLASVLQIIWIDILLSGDNAVVIALACRSLPEHQRRVGVLLGAGTAVLLRIVFAFVISFILAVPFLKVVGGVLLLWIAIKLVKGEEEDEHNVKESDTLWKAVRTIAIADAVMSLDNVIAIAAAAKGHPELFVFGLMLSIPLIVTGAAVIMKLLTRLPALVWAGAALLGWIAGEMFVSDPFVVGQFGEAASKAHYPAALLGAGVVMLAGFILARRTRSGEPTAA